MANDSLGALIVSIEADLTKLKKGLGDADTAVKETERKVNVSTKGIATAFLTVGTAVAGAFVGMIAQTVKYGDEIFEVSQRTGIATETLSRLKFVAEQTESSFEAVTSGLKFLNRTMFESVTGNKNLAIVFEVLGVNVKTANGDLRKADEVLLDLADSFKKIEDPAAKTALAMQIFGRGGQQLIPILNLGSDGIRKLSEEADKLGLTLSGANAREIDEFSDNMKALQASFGGLTLAVGKAFIPALTTMVNFIKDSVVPVLENLDALLNNTGSKLASEQTQEAFASQDKVLENALIKINELRQRREDLLDAQASSQGKGNFDPAIESIDIQIQRVETLIQARRQQYAEEQAGVQNLEPIKVIAHQNDMQRIQERQIKAEAEQIGYKTFANQIQALGQNVQNAFSNALSALILNGGKAKDIFKALGETLVKALVDFIAQQIIAVTIGKAIRAAETALLAAMGATVAAAWAPAAAFVSLASFGANAAPASAGILSTVALSQGLAATSAVAGLAEGTDTVPSMLSPGEMIVPRSFADAIRSGDLSLSGNGGGAGKTVNVTNNFRFDNVTLSNEISLDALTEALGSNIEKTLRRI